MIVKDVMYPEKYTMNGEEKTKWHNCGALFIKDDGKISLKLTMIPVNFDGQMQVFDKQPKQQQHAQPQQQAPQYQQPQQGQYNAPQVVQQNVQQQEMPF